MIEETEAPHPELMSDIKMGLPLSLSQEIADANLSGPVRWLGHWLFMIIMFGGFAFGIWLWAFLDKQVENNAKQVAMSLEGIAIETNFGVSLVFALFIWIVASATLTSFIILKSTPKIKATFYLNSRQQFIGATPKLFGLHHIAATSDRFISGYDYIDKICKKMISATAKFVVPGTLISFGLILCELSSFRIITPHAHVIDPFFSNKLQIREWTKAQRVQLGCNYIKARKNKNEESSFIYDVEWPDGKSFRLTTQDQINGKSWLENFEAIDAKIRSGDAIFERWEWRNRDPLHPKCLNNFYSQAEKSQKIRIDRLLRIGVLD